MNRVLHLISLPRYDSRPVVLVYWWGNKKACIPPGRVASGRKSWQPVGVPDEPPLVPVELMPPQSGDQSAGPPPMPPHEAAGSRARTPFHPAAATLLLVFDNLWMIPEFTIVDLIFTVPLCFLCVFVSTFSIQRRMQHDLRWTAFWKALLLGIIAAVPFSVTGTPVGLALLAWFGIKKWRE